jgi:hypothetical protein
VSGPFLNKAEAFLNQDSKAKVDDNNEHEHVTKNVKVEDEGDDEGVPRVGNVDQEIGDIKGKLTDIAAEKDDVANETGTEVQKEIEVKGDDRDEAAVASI